MTLNLLPKDGCAALFPQAFEPLVADAFFVNLLETINWRGETAFIFGRSIALPRLTAWYGDKPYKYSGVTHTPQPWTPLLLEIKVVAETIAQTGFNSVLLNLYRNGRDGMGWHADDEATLGDNPTIASISFGTMRKFQMRHRDNKSLRVATALTHGSCLVMAGEMQTHWQHQIPKTAQVVGPRVNLTFRTIV